MYESSPESSVTAGVPPRTGYPAGLDDPDELFGCMRGGRSSGGVIGRVALRETPDGILWSVGCGARVDPEGNGGTGGTAAFLKPEDDAVRRATIASLSPFDWVEYVRARC